MKTFQTVAEVLDFAIREETRAFEFYRDLAQRSPSVAFRQVLEGFAAEELLHRQRLEEVRRGTRRLDTDPTVGHLDIAETVTPVAPTPDMSYLDLLGVALKRELQAYRTYLYLAETTQDPALSRLCEQLSREEAEHKLRLEVEYDLLTF